MADLDNILIFVKVAQFESISGAARSFAEEVVSGQFPDAEHSYR